MASRIMIVDDNLDVRDMLGRIVSLAGHSFVTFESREEALLHVDKKIAVIFLDLRMPGMLARDFIVQARDKNPAVRIVLFSASFYLSNTAIEMGIEFMRKPFEIERVHYYLKTIENLKLSAE